MSARAVFDQFYFRLSRTISYWRKACSQILNGIAVTCPYYLRLEANWRAALKGLSLLPSSKAVPGNRRFLAISFWQG